MGGASGEGQCGSLGLTNKALHSLSLGPPVLMGVSWAWFGEWGGIGRIWNILDGSLQRCTWYMASVAGMGTLSLFRRSGRTHRVVPPLLLYLSTANGVGSSQFQMEAVPSTFQKPASGDLA